MKIHEKVCQKIFRSSRKLSNLPHTTSGSKYSAYFDFDISKTNATCKICGKVLSLRKGSVKGSTSGMKHHIEKKHNIADFGDNTTSKTFDKNVIAKNTNLASPSTLDVGSSHQNESQVNEEWKINKKHKKFKIKMRTTPKKQNSISKEPNLKSPHFMEHEVPNSFTNLIKLEQKSLLCGYKDGNQSKTKIKTYNFF